MKSLKAMKGQPSLADVRSGKWLALTPMDVAAKWWCEMNCFNWTVDFPLKKPLGFDALTNCQKYEHPYWAAAFNAVNEYVPRKEQSRAWHMEGYCGPKKTVKEFEAWWATRESGTVEEFEVWWATRESGLIGIEQQKDKSIAVTN